MKFYKIAWIVSLILTLLIVLYIISISIEPMRETAGNEIIVKNHEFSYLF